MYQTSLLLFRRDLRLHDNRSLMAALAHASRVVPCFILDKTLLQQLDGHLPRVQYLLRALVSLDAALRRCGTQLHVVHETPAAGLAQLQQSFKAEAVFFHRDFGSYAVKRDAVLRRQCHTLGMDCHAVDDVTLHAPEDTLKPDGTPYTVFTPFFRRAGQRPVERPRKARLDRLVAAAGKAFSLQPALDRAGLVVATGESPETQAQDALRQLVRLHDYENVRDVPALEGTSRLSAALRFGVISVREMWWAVASSLGNEHPLLRQLYWRDFFYSIGHYFPRVFSGCFNEKYNRIAWPGSAANLAAWQQGKTGFPIVDAGLSELRNTGYMHNRVRMVVASFLVKDLHCDWRHGERHFARNLLDYDPCINNGNWQWAASTGCDAQPYFRVFNPWTQQQKFDPDLAYIKRWLPALKSVPAKTLHRLYCLDHALSGYVQPVVDHAVQGRLAKELFESVR